MITKKVCLLGTLSVGKTSLVRRYVDSLFSDNYQTTIGVKVDRKIIQVDDQAVTMMLWDLEGVDKYHDLRSSHLRGAGGYFVVADGTRPASFDHALALRAKVQEVLPGVPCQLILNKCDLVQDWRLDTARLGALDDDEFPPIRTSAKDGQNVEHMFETLGRRILLCAENQKIA